MKAADVNPPAPGGAPDTRAIVKLDPLVVEDDAGTPWLISRMDGTEVLSRCSNELTAALINRYQRLNAMLALIYPVELQPSHDVPVTLLIENTHTNPVTDRLFRQQFRLSATRSTAGYLPNFHRWDGDSQAIHFVLKEFEDGFSPITITPAYLRYLLETRSPTLPRWFIEGMVTLHKTVVMPVPPVIELSDGDTLLQYRPPYPYDKVTVLPFVWQSAEKTRQMHTVFKRAARTSGRMQLPDSFPLLPLEKLLGLPSLAGLSPEEAAIFPYQAALLIRWALDPKQQELRNSQANAKSNPAALWQFVADEAADDALSRRFVRAFGESMADVEVRLRGYLPFACLDSADFALKPAGSSDFATPGFAQATPLEVSLLKGRFERLEAIYIHTLHPELSDEFAAHARLTLGGDRSREQLHPGQLAELGLLEVDLGNDAAARPLLDAAAKSRVPHPRVYLELARIDYDHWRKAPPDADKAPEEMARIEQLLRTCIEQRPVLPGAYALLFDVWLQQNRAPSPDEFLLLEKGPRLFPRNFRILYGAALLQATHGQTEQARLLVARGLPVFPTGKEHTRLVQLQQIVAAAPSQ